MNEYGVEDDRGFGTVERPIMRNKELTGIARLIYAYLASFAGDKEEAWPSSKTVCEELIISRNTFYKHLNILKESGIISTRQENKSDGKFSKTIFTIHKLPYLNRCDTVEPCTNQRYTVRRTTNNNSLLNNNKENILKEKVKKEKAELDLSEVPNELTKDIESFIDFRKSKGNPMSQRALNMLLNKLKGFTEQEGRDAIEAAIIGDYSSIYPKKSYSPQSKKTNKSFVELIEEDMEKEKEEIVAWI